jgi:diadenosine tetraphosphate (Ap4A) HIT family hydrolase
MSWLRDYGYSDCVFCDIVKHQPWEPAAFVYEDADVAVFHNILGWVPVMLIAVPTGHLENGAGGRPKHHEQQDLWRRMGHLGAVAMGLGRAYCEFGGTTRFRLVSNFGSLAMQSQSHAHLHILGAEFPPSYPDLRCRGRLVNEDADLLCFADVLEGRGSNSKTRAIMVVPRSEISQDEFFSHMDRYGARILQIASAEMGGSYRLLAEVGPHSPIPDDGAHLFILGGGSLGHYV